MTFKMHMESDIEKYRAKTMLTKEPEMIAWIDDMPTDSILFDVGANVGIYSLYAGSKGIMVHAYEPSIYNFVRLVLNIDQNEGFKIVPHYCAVGDGDGVIKIKCPSKEFGATGSQMGNEGTYVPMVRMSDEIAKVTAIPMYLKIDIDGQEMAVLQGARKGLSFVNSCLIEVDHTTTDVKEVDRIMATAGLFRDSKYMDLENHSTKRRGGNPENIIYSRK